MFPICFLDQVSPVSGLIFFVTRFWSLAMATAAEAPKLLYIVVVDGSGGDGDERKNERASFRYTRSLLQSTLQLMGCKARHAFKVLPFFFFKKKFLFPVERLKSHRNFTKHCKLVFLNGKIFNEIV